MLLQFNLFLTYDEAANIIRQGFAYLCLQVKNSAYMWIVHAWEVFDYWIGALVDRLVEP